MEETKKKTTRKTSLKKTTTTPKAKEHKVEEKEVSAQAEEIKVKEFKNDELIPTKSVFAGSCTLVGRRTRNVYVWETLGEIQYVEYQDLLAEITNRYSHYIYDPLFLIEDEDVVNKYPKLKELYEGMLDIEDVKDSLLNDSVENLKNILITLPSGLKETVQNIASTLMQEGELYDVRKIRLIDDLYGTALTEQLNIFN